MRSTLSIKFILIYIAFGFLCIFSVEALARVLTMERLEEEAGTSLYQEASIMASDSLPSYFARDISREEASHILKEMQDYLETNIWLVKRDGSLIISHTLDGQNVPPQQIEKFDPVELGNKIYTIGKYHNYYSEDVITVIVPVTRGFSTDGYLLLHKPYSVLEERCLTLLTPMYITVGVIYIMSFVILIAVQFLIRQPLRKITEAAKQYASGNLDHEIPITTEDEIGYLSASLNYMSSQLKDMKEYQKQFVANISHDFRSPLTSIKGYVEAIADGTIPPEHQDRYFKIILSETERLTDLTQDLLTLNELDSQNLVLNRETFDLHELIKTTVVSFEGRCAPRKISIELLFASKILNINADRRKIQQAIYNLLDNAIKFSLDDSTITVETSERNGKVIVSVKDRGLGIPKKDLNKIWERFYKTDASRGKDKKGTGLGLAIVKEIIQAHNENIHVVSTEGVGTEFIFTVPKA